MTSFHPTKQFHQTCTHNNGIKIKRKDSHDSSLQTNINILHNMKLNENIGKKKDNNKSNGYHSIKRPQTPDPVSSYAFGLEGDKLPEPQVILKQIQRSVNVLKQMYYASLSQHNSLKFRQSSMKNSEEGLFLNHSQQSHYNRKSVERLGVSKKSIPQITVTASFQPHPSYDMKKNRKKGIQEFLNINSKDGQTEQNKQKDKLKREKSKQPKKNNSNQATKSRECLEKNFSQRRKSATSIHKNTKQNRSNNCEQVQTKKIKEKETKVEINNGKNQNPVLPSGQQQQSSKALQPANIQNQNYPSTAYTSNNHSQDKSYGKDTPNNSTTKNTTNHKNSTVSRLCGSQIDPSIQISVEEDPFREYKSPHYNKQSRNNSNSNSKPDIKSKKQKIEKNIQKRKKSSKTLNAKQRSLNRSKNNPHEQLKIKEGGLHKKEEEKQKQKVFKKKSTEKRTQKDVKVQKIFKKKPTLKQSDFTSHQFHVENYAQLPVKSDAFENKTYQKQLYQCIDKLEFPQIQSLVFNRNMPILEQDSREEVSSSIILLTGQNQGDTIRSERIASAGSSHNKQQHPQYSKIVQQIGLYCSQTLKQPAEYFKRTKFQEQSKAGSKLNRIQQNTRFPTPSFVTSDADSKIQKYSKDRIGSLENQSTTKSKVEGEGEAVKTHSEEDSLAGCEIPRREGQSFDLDNFQLVSFEL